MGERLLCKQEVIGSIPFTSTGHLPGISPGQFPWGRSAAAIGAGFGAISAGAGRCLGRGGGC